MGEMRSSDGRLVIGDRMTLSSKDPAMKGLGPIMSAVFVDQMDSGKWLIAEVKMIAEVGFVTQDCNCFEIDPQFWEVAQIEKAPPEGNAKEAEGWQETVR